MALHRPPRALTVLMLLAAGLALAACDPVTLQARHAPAAQPAAATPSEPGMPSEPAAPPASPPPSTPSTAQAAPQADPEPEEPMTRERASATCWMRVERRGNLSIDARVKLVDQCIDEQMRR